MISESDVYITSAKVAYFKGHNQDHAFVLQDCATSKKSLASWLSEVTESNGEATSLVALDFVKAPSLIQHGLMHTELRLMFEQMEHQARDSDLY